MDIGKLNKRLEIQRNSTPNDRSSFGRLNKNFVTLATVSGSIEWDGVSEPEVGGQVSPRRSGKVTIRTPRAFTLTSADRFKWGSRILWIVGPTKDLEGKGRYTVASIEEVEFPKE